MARGMLKTEEKNGQREYWSKREPGRDPGTVRAEPRRDHPETEGKGSKRWSPR